MTPENLMGLGINPELATRIGYKIKFIDLSAENVILRGPGNFSIIAEVLGSNSLVLPRAGECDLCSCVEVFCGSSGTVQVEAAEGDTILGSAAVAALTGAVFRKINATEWARFG